MTPPGSLSGNWHFFMQTNGCWVILPPKTIETFRFAKKNTNNDWWWMIWRFQNFSLLMVLSIKENELRWIRGVLGNFRQFPDIPIKLFPIYEQLIGIALPISTPPDWKKNLPHWAFSQLRETDFVGSIDVPPNVWSSSLQACKAVTSAAPANPSTARATTLDGQME